MLLNSPLRVLLISLLAALVYGSWAAFVNSEYGTWVALRSGLGQAAYASFSTALVTSVVLWLSAKFSGDFASFQVFFLSVCVMLSIPIAIHLVLRTPDIIEAILPGLVMGSVYIVFVMRTSKAEN